MKKVCLLILLASLGGCEIGNFSEREKLYGKDTIANVCVENPELCNSDDDTGW